MLQTLAITAPIYLLIALGYAAGRTGVVSKADSCVLGAFVVKFALPALVFSALSQRSIGEVLNGRFLLAYAIGSLAVMAIGFSWGVWRQKKAVTLSAFCGLGMSASNSGFIGYPIAAQVFGAAPAAIALAMCLIVENMLIIPSTLVLADSGLAGGRDWRGALVQALAQQTRNPLIWGIVAGFCVSLFRVSIPAPLSHPIAMLAAATPAVALFAVGALLVDLPLAGMWRDVSAIALGKLVLHPAAIGLAAWLLLPDEATYRVAAIIFASAPMIGIYPLLAQKYGLESLCAAALLLATTASFVTISVALWALGPLLHWTS